MTNKLHELQEQASPGPWRVVRSYPNNGVVEYSVLTDGDKNVSLKASELYESDAKLAALAPHLLPLAKALEEGPCGGTHDWPNYKLHDNCTSICSRCCALKALPEAPD